MHKYVAFLSVVALVVGGCGGGGDGGGDSASAKQLILATTTSTVDSGLLDGLVPRFERETGYTVKTLALGSGEAIELAERGEADVLLVHSPKAEQELMATGKAGRRLLVMHNRFLVVGPTDDPAGVHAATDAADALARIAEARDVFVSRGDGSGTNKFELSLWETAGIDPAGSWYQSTGQGMGATLQIAAEKSGYTITDNATYLATRDTTNLANLFDEGRELVNVYHVIELTEQAGPRVNARASRAFAEFMVAPGTQRLIGSFGRARYGQALFVPDAGKADA